jgi:hypothetical protein
MVLTVTGFIDFVYHAEFEITGKRNFSGTGSNSVFKRREGDTYPVRSVRANLSHWTKMLAVSEGPNKADVSLPSPEDGNRSSFGSAVF